MQGLLNDVNNGKGTIGKFFSDDSLYRKADDPWGSLIILRMNSTRDRGAWANLIKDDTFSKNANQTIAKANKLVD